MGGAAQAGQAEAPDADLRPKADDVPPPTEADVVRKLLLGAFANAAEWYDFCMFGFLAPQIGRAFFPHAASPALELIRAFGVFAAAFVARPIGAVVFGVAGDRLGRKQAVYASVMMMAFSTFAVGVLPKYSVAGWVAPVLLVLCRINQGLSVGGQYVGTMLLTTEGMPENRKALYFSISVCSGQTSMSVAALVVAGLHWSMTEAALDDWGWRIPFLTGIIAALGAHSVHSGMAESSEFEAAKLTRDSPHSENERGCFSVLNAHRWPLLQIMAITAGGGVVGYNTGVWLPSYLTRMHQPPLADAYLIVTVVTMCTCLVTPLVAFLAGRWPMLFLVLGLGASAALTLPVFAAAESGNTWAIAVALAAILLANNAWWVTLGSWMPFLVEPRARYTVTAVGYNAGISLLGGCIPMLSTMLARHFGTALAAGVFQLGVLLVSLSFASCLARSFAPKSGEGSSAPSLYEMVPSIERSPGQA